MGMAASSPGTVGLKANGSEEKFEKKLDLIGGRNVSRARA
jgi:hypothetical protein